jgi:hypothetical protein
MAAGDFARDQAGARALGGRSSREARRSEGSVEERVGVILWPRRSGGKTNKRDAANFSEEPTGAEGGRSGSWQGL